jgi:hypothetical protein
VLRDVIAGFLDTVTEREFDAPLLALLAARGFTDIHFTHGAFECKHSAHSRVVMVARVLLGYGENACAGGRHGLPSMRSCRTSMAFLPCLRAVSM